MYTDEDKVFCVKRMWAEGLTPTAASRLWGAPSRRTLAAWEKEALGGGLAVEAPRVPGACRRAKHARYPEETRAEALRLLGLGKPTREIARALGLPSGSVVSRWAAEARRRAKMADLCQDFGHGSSRNHAAMGSLPSAGLVRSKNNSMARAGIW